MANAQLREPCDSTLFQSWVKLIGYGLIVALVAYFAGAYLRSSRMVPFMDDWTYVHAIEMGWLERLNWLFAQHVDHRIPVQKTLQFALLSWSGFDFRSLIAVNVVLCALLSVIYMETARIVRGVRSMGDWIIPLMLLSPATGPSLWGFEFQFMSSVLLLASGAYAAVAHLKTRHGGWQWLVLAICLVNAFCGINGLLTTSLFLPGLAIIRWKYREQLPPVRPWMRLAAVGVGAICVSLWYLWTPSQASAGSVDPRIFATYAFGMYGSPFVIYSFVGGALKGGLVLGMAAAALAAIGWVLLRGHADSSAVVVALTIACSCLLGLSIAAGRAKFQGGWDPVNGMHYSFLMMPIFLGSWIVLSFFMRSGVIRGTVALLLLYLCSAAYLANAKWRFEHVDDVSAKRAQLAKDLRASLPAQAIASNYLPEMSADRTQEAQISHDLEILRRYGYSRYGARN
jgi:hypothetical protein